MKRVLQNHKGLHYGLNIFVIEKVSYDSLFYCFEEIWNKPSLRAGILRGKF